MHKHYYLIFLTLLVFPIIASEKKELQKRIDFLNYDKDTHNILLSLASGAGLGILATDLIAKNGAIDAKTIVPHMACMMTGSINLAGAKRTKIEIEALVKKYPYLNSRKTHSECFTYEQIFYIGMFLGAGLQPGTQLFTDDEDAMKKTLTSAMIIQTFSVIGLLHSFCAI